jgi:alpha-glucosidase
MASPLRAWQKTGRRRLPRSSSLTHDPAPWWKTAVVYQIYPRSFFDTDGDGVGDLKGVAAKLDYVASLGVDAIWLSPFFRSPMKDFGYDVSDYCDVDPLFGSMKDFDALLAGVHARGMKLIIDQVWSHTSDRHPWFQESASSKDNPKADWYVWADAKPDGTPPNNWLATFGGPSWTWSPVRRQYYLHNFLTSQPDLNYWNLEVQHAILEVARFWLDRGVDGFRLDVINMIVHDRELRDNPVARYNRPPATATQFQEHVHDRTRPEALEFVERLRALTDQYQDRMTVGETVATHALELQQEYTEGQNRLHTAYSFYLLNARAAAPELFAHTLQAWSHASGWPAWSLGNHDVPRFPTRLGGGDPRQTRMLLALLLCLRGSPYLYQGDELGLPQAHVPFERLQDPFAIAAYTGDAFRDGARTPMPWSSEAPNGGFSTAAETWLPTDPAHLLLAAAGQEADAESTLNFTRRFLDLRRTLPALQTGEARVLDAPAGVLAFERTCGGERLLCLFEMAGATARFDHADLHGGTAAALHSGASHQGDRVDLPPFAVALVRL